MRPRLRLLRLGWGLAALFGCSQDPTAADPEGVFADGFLSPREEVVMEAWDGTRVRGWDAWLRRLPEGRVVLRHEADYEPVDCAEPRAWFLSRRGAAPTGFARDPLDCWEYRDPRFHFDNGRWLIRDLVDGRLYYRVWKHYD